MAEPGRPREVRESPGPGVEWETVFRLIRPTGVPVPLPGLLSYSPQRPYEVTLDLRPGTRAAVRWVLSRDLLLTGVRTRCGSGRVRIAPVPGPGPAGTVLLRLGPPGALAVLATDRYRLRVWLASTRTLVPPGTEHSHVDWDGLVADLLG